MLPVDFKGSNYQSEIPARFEKDCIPIPGMRGIDKQGNPYILMQFQPSKEDIEAILAGRPVCIAIYNHKITCPMAVYTYDENFQVNI